MLLGISRGLQFCHEGCGGAFCGEILLHRDLKPENVLLRRDPDSDEITAVLGDFGISRLIPACSAGGHAKTQRVWGTIGCVHLEFHRVAADTRLETYCE